MSNGFEHSVRVPRLYKVTAKTVQAVEEDGASLKDLIYATKHTNLKGTYALALNTILHGAELDLLLRKSEILVKEPRLDAWLVRVLIAELLWGKETLPSISKPLITVLSYEKILRDAFNNFVKTNVEDAVKSVRATKPRFVRINTLVKSIEDSIRSFTDEGWNLLPKSRNYSAFLKDLTNLNDGMFIQDFHIPELLVFPSGTAFYNHPGYKCGAIVLQDKASCLPAYLLNPTPGSTVLDMCSAPGMKTTHLAAIMNNTGKIYAVERDFRRYRTLCEMVKMNAADCVMTIHEDAMKVDPKLRKDVEYILVDPSCSGSGMQDRISLGKSNTKCVPGRLVNLQSFQVLLLRHALLNFPKAKRIVYSTCSVYPEENEMVVDEILENIGNAYELVPIKKLIGSDWKNFSSTDYKCQDRCLYARPDVDLSNGFFVAVFERNFDVPLPEYKRYNASGKRKNSEEFNDAGKQNGNVMKKIKKGKTKGVTDESKILKRQEESVDNEKKGLKIVEKESVSKIRKSKNKIRSEFESVAEEVPDEETPKKKKKTKRKNKQEIVYIDEDDEGPDAINGNELSAEKKKKKKKDKDVEIFETLESLPDEEQKIKKRKKKKRLEVEILEEISPMIEISDEKSKKKRKKRSEVKILEVIGPISDDQPSKKKKKKRSESEPEILEVVSSTVDISEDQENEKKKKKKKKKNNTET